jgi:predicted glutamine amidotransferase
MCGLAGIAGTLERVQGRDDFATFSQLLLVSSFRGTDSTGVVGRKFRDDKGETNMVKMTLPSPEFLDMAKTRSLIVDSDQLLIGHCRSKTVGDVKKSNAQPFDFDNVVGTHNGTLDWATKNTLEGPGIHFGTDSEALYYRLDRDGLDKMLAMTSKEDAMALVWYNKKDHTLNFYRNDRRPLYYVYDEKRERIFWASEAGMLYLILNRNKIAFQKVHMLPENVHFCLALPDKRGAKLPKPATKTVKQKEKPRPLASAGSTMTQNGRGSQLIVRDNRACADQLSGLAHLKNSTAASSTSQTIGPRVNTDLFKLDRMIVRSKAQGGNHYRSPQTGKAYDEDQFNIYSRGCCSCCGAEPLFGEPIKFLRQDDFLCSSCVQEANADAKAGNVDGTALQLLVNFS